METPFKKVRAKRIGRKVILPCRLSYVHLDKPRASVKDGKEKYSVSCLVPKEDKEAVQLLQEAYEQAFEEGCVSLWKKKRPNRESKNWHNPIKDGDRERPDDPNYAGMVFLGPSSARQVPTMNRLKEDISPEDVYSGCWGIVSIDFYAFDQGSQGVTVGLNAVVKYADGERFAGGQDGRKDFDGYDMDDDEDLDNL